MMAAGTGLERIFWGSGATRRQDLTFGEENPASYGCRQARDLDGQMQAQRRVLRHPTLCGRSIWHRFSWLSFP